MVVLLRVRAINSQCYKVELIPSVLCHTNVVLVFNVRIIIPNSNIDLVFWFSGKMTSFVDIGSKKLTAAEGLQEKVERINTERGNGLLVCNKILYHAFQIDSLGICPPCTEVSKATGRPEGQNCKVQNAIQQTPWNASQEHGSWKWTWPVPTSGCIWGLTNFQYGILLHWVSQMVNLSHACVLRDLKKELREILVQLIKDDCALNHVATRCRHDRNIPYLFLK